MTRKRIALVAAVIGCVAAAGVVARGRPGTHHPVGAPSLGTPISGHTLDEIVDQPGPVNVETVHGADWHVPLSGLLNLDHPRARAAGLQDREEPIQVSLHALHHPTRGTFLVDTGVERAFFESPEHAVIDGLVARVMHVGDMKRIVDTKTWIERQPRPVAGVFLTHLHADHVTGLRDVPSSVQVFVGPGEATSRAVESFFSGPIVDRALAGKPPLAEWRFERDETGAFEGILDVFGDRSVFALHVPGHTVGSVAFVARTPSGAVLLTGDACHTRWGWDQGVEPGYFSHDRAKSAESLARLRAFAARHPAMDVRVGHQSAPSALHASHSP
jgi:N-acyl homoserine lactone hydrolase